MEMTEKMWEDFKNAPITIQTPEPVFYSTGLKYRSETLGSVERDNSTIQAFNVAGIKIKCEEEFVNKTKDMYLHFIGKGKVLDKELAFEETIYVDTDIYDRYDWNIKNGVLYVTLYEKINPRPDFKRVKKPAKKVEAVEENK